MTQQDRTDDSSQGDRIAKVLARAGVASRRDVERMIAEGRVKVNGEVLTTPAFKVPAGAVLQVDGKVVGDAEPSRMWRYHKPAGLVTTHRDEKGRKTVFEFLPPDMPRVISVGRLDLNSEGLLLLTNDGSLARRLELPATGWTRRYRVRFFGNVDQAELDKLKKGVTVDGVRYGAIDAVLERSKGQNSWASVSLQEGKNREVRKAFEFLGLKVSRLIRTAYGPFQLGDLAEGQAQEISGKVIKEQLGLAKNPQRAGGVVPAPKPRADKTADAGETMAKPGAKRVMPKSRSAMADRPQRPGRDTGPAKRPGRDTGAPKRTGASPAKRGKPDRR